jgi:hypothetical protein
VVIWDRRTGQDRRRRSQSVPVERRIRRRRHPNGTAVLASRGFFVVRPIRRAAGCNSVAMVSLRWPSSASSPPGWSRFPEKT